MNVFGSQWEGHFFKIRKDWQDRVSPDDIVLIPGDISWAMQIELIQEDLKSIGDLPGKKIMIRGNHDYWWGSISKLRSVLPPGLFAIQNDALKLSDFVFCGSRGWIQPSDENDAETIKIYQRELLRTEMSLSAARRLRNGEMIIALSHFPPSDSSGHENSMTDLFTKYGVSHVVYGHLHAEANQFAFAGKIGSVDYHPVSCDGLGFKLYELPVIGQVENEDF